MSLKVGNAKIREKNEKRARGALKIYFDKLRENV